MADGFAHATIPVVNQSVVLPARATRVLNDLNLLRGVVRIVEVRAGKVDRAAVLAAPNLGVDGTWAAGGGDGRRACRLAARSDAVEGTSWLVAPKSVLIIVVVDHFVTPSTGPGQTESAVKMTIVYSGCNQNATVCQLCDGARWMPHAPQPA